MTSIEWLYDQMIIAENIDYRAILKKAKEMHKQEIINAWKNGYGGDEHDENEYYNNTFKKY